MVACRLWVASMCERRWKIDHYCRQGGDEVKSPYVAHANSWYRSCIHTLFIIYCVSIYTCNTERGRYRGVEMHESRERGQHIERERARILTVVESFSSIESTECVHLTCVHGARVEVSWTWYVQSTTFTRQLLPCISIQVTCKEIVHASNTVITSEHEYFVPLFTPRWT